MQTSYFVHLFYISCPIVSFPNATSALQVCAGRLVGSSDTMRTASDTGGTVSGFAGWLAGDGALYVLNSDVANGLAPPGSRLELLLDDPRQ